MKNKIGFGIKITLILVTLVLSIYFIKILNDLNMIPDKYFILMVLIIASVNIVADLCIILKKTWTKMISGLLYAVMIVGLIFGINYGKTTDKFLDTAFDNVGKELTTYNLLVLNNNVYNELKDIENKKVGYLVVEDEKDESINELKKIIQIKEKDYDDIYYLYVSLLHKDVDAILIDINYMDTLEEEYKDIYDETKKIYSIDIEDKEIDVPSSTTTSSSTSSTSKNKGSTNKKTNKVTTTKKKAINSRSFNIFISGSDSRSSTIKNKTRSDVNMIMTVNRDTKTILLTSIPRDYYVQVHGQTGLKDKLTHAGIYGLDRSTKTIEDLFKIKIAYSVKVNFNSVVKVVDLVGGIDVYSDKTFKSYHMKGWTVQKGINHMNGAKALAYARERYAYASGDRHRIKNQQQVLEETLKKIMSDSSILLKYDEVLSSLSNLYRTDIPRDFITSVVKEQLNDMSGWKFVTQTVDGKGAMRPTHTAPKSKRYVMIPYSSDVTRARKKINEIL